MDEFIIPYVAVSPPVRIPQSFNVEYNQVSLLNNFSLEPRFDSDRQRRHRHMGFGISSHPWISKICRPSRACQAVYGQADQVSRVRRTRGDYPADTQSMDLKQGRDRRRRNPSVLEVRKNKE